MELLSSQESNTKLAKNRERTWGLSLAPADSSGRNVCPHSTEGCRAACVAHSGLSSVFPTVHAARVAKTQFFFADRRAFLAQLVRELGNKDRLCRNAGIRGYVRLNTFSDIPYERMIDLAQFRALRFYDYTKDIRRAAAQIRSRTYRLCYSYNEESDPREVAQLLKSGGTASLVLAIRYVHAQNQDPAPRRVMIGSQYFPATDGDRHDNRFRQLPGTVAVLRLKGSRAMREAALESGFARPVALTVRGR
jgi:hypothetical protein